MYHHLNSFSFVYCKIQKENSRECSTQRDTLDKQSIKLTINYIHQIYIEVYTILKSGPWVSDRIWELATSCLRTNAFSSVIEKQLAGKSP